MALVLAGFLKSLLMGIRFLLYGGLLLDLACLVAAAPALLFPGRFTPLALVLLCIPWLRRLASQRRLVSRTPMNLPILGLVLMAFLGTYISSDLSLSLPKLYGILLGVTVFYVTVDHARTPQRRLAVAFVLALATVGVSLLALVGTYWKDASPSIFVQLYSRLPRLITQVQSSQQVSIGFNANEVAGTLTLLVPFVLAPILFSNVRGWRKGGPILVSFLGASVLLLTLSRGGYMAFFLSLLLLGSLRWPGIRRFLPVLVAVAGFLLLSLGPGRIFDFVSTMEGTTGSVSWPSRMKIWWVALSMIRDFPFTGIGLNTFPLVSERLYSDLLLGFVRQEPAPHAHSLFLQVGVDLGLPGLAAFLALMAVTWLKLYREWKGGQERWLVAGLATGLFAHLVFNLTDAVTLGAKPGVALWMVLGVIAALGCAPGQGRAEIGGRGDDGRSEA